jgi:hypothetical protein
LSTFGLVAPAFEFIAKKLLLTSKSWNFSPIFFPVVSLQVLHFSLIFRCFIYKIMSLHTGTISLLPLGKRYAFYLLLCTIALARIFSTILDGSGKSIHAIFIGKNTSTFHHWVCG